MNKMDIMNRKNFISQIIEKDFREGKFDYVKTRFPPEPNGYLHIGHAKSICLNFDISKQYSGKFNLRFDDTNPISEKLEYINSIKKDIIWLGLKWDGEVKYASDYFNIIFQYAIDLIKKGLAYVDELKLEDVHKYRGTLKKSGKNSPYRNRTIDENLFLFNKMKLGKFKAGSACLRAKIDMSSSILIMRDPVLYRIKYNTHYKTKDKWCIYPTYDFAHCISDAIEGITHSICTLEFQNNRFLYDWILDNIDVQIHPRQCEFSRLNLSNSIMSKKKISTLINKKIVRGWDDPRLPTISGLRRKGYTPKSIRKFCRFIGISKQESNIDMSFLESCIRDELNENAKRFMAVLDPVKLVIENMSEDNFIITAFNHPKKMDFGTRKIFFTKEIYIDRSDFKEKYSIEYKRLSLGKRVKLRYSFVIKAHDLKKDADGKINTIYCTFYPNSLKKNYFFNKKVCGVIHWVSKVYGLKAEIRLYDNLFLVSNPSEYKDYMSIINPNSLVVKFGIVEPILKFSKPGSSYQFEREGYFCADIKDHNSKNLVFNRIVKLRHNFRKL